MIVTRALTKAVAGPALAMGLGAAAVGCAADGTPTVEIEHIAPQKLIASDDAKDDLTIVVRYADGDGDLGQGVAKILDCRADGLVTELPIPRLANADAVAKRASIQGELSLMLADVGALAASSTVPAACADLGVSAPDGGAQSFCVILVDAAGNESEGTCTDPVKILP